MALPLRLQDDSKYPPEGEQIPGPQKPADFGAWLADIQRLPRDTITLRPVVAPGALTGEVIGDEDIAATTDVSGLMRLAWRKVGRGESGGKDEGKPGLT